MGFGLLFFGYFLTFAFPIDLVSDITGVLGCAVMLFACVKLVEYNRYFTGVMVSAMLLSVVSLAGVLIPLFSFETGSLADTVMQIAKNFASCAVHICIFLGTRGISLGASCEKLAKKAERDLVMTMTYYVVFHVIFFTKSLYAETAPMVMLWINAYWWLCFILNLALLYQAFGIFYSADEDPNQKKRSRFRLINYIDDKMDVFEENTKKYRKESMEMALAEAEKRQQERDKKHKKGKKKKK